jgi:hypothetical protein
MSDPLKCMERLMASRRHYLARLNTEKALVFGAPDACLCNAQKQQRHRGSTRRWSTIRRNVLSGGLHGKHKHISMRFADLPDRTAEKKNFLRRAQTKRSVWLMP